MDARARILVIDDDQDMCAACQRILSRQGLLVDTATRGEEGLRRIESDGYDVVLLDVMMPDANGIDLLAPIRARDPHLVCVVVTCLATTDVAVRAIKEGAYDFITKPFTPDDLLLVVRQALERRHLAKEAERLARIEEEAKRLAEEKARLEAVDHTRIECIRLITHELRAPIAAIQSYLNLILEGIVPQEQLMTVIAKAELRARQQLELIADLLEWSRVKEAPMPKEAGLSRLDTALEDVVEQFEAQAAEKHLQLGVEVSGDIPPVRAGPEALKSVWTNLVGNAIKYTPDGGSVQIRLACHDGHVVGQVSDSGIGIPEEARPRLFTEFFRAKNAKAFCKQGTGLGLAIVRQIIEGAGGRIEVDSEVGRGTVVTFTLPLADAEPLAERPADGCPKCFALGRAVARAQRRAGRADPARR